MELRKVTLTNVRNFESKTFEFNGSTDLVMRNKGGKSTLADSITFLLIGKLYNGSSDIASLKPVIDTSREVSVEASFITDGGDELLLKKVYKENWVKTRGSSTEELKGHTTTCYINDKKLTLSNYDSELCSYFNVPSTKEINIMLNPYYFSQTLSWQERLEYVQRVTGEVTVDDVVDCAPDTEEIKDDLEKYGIEDLSKRYKRDANDKKEKVNEIKIQIKGDQIKTVVDKKTYEDAKNEYDINLETITNKRVELNGIQNPTLEKLKERKNELRTLISQSKDADREELSKKNASINTEIDKLREEKQSEQDLISQVRNEIGGMKNDIKSLNLNINASERIIANKSVEKTNLVVSYKDWKNRSYEPLESRECPNCGFDLTKEENDKQQIEFNEAKAEKLKSINSNGSQLAKEIADAKKQIESDQEEISLIQETIDAKQKEIEEHQKTIEELKGKITELDMKKIYAYTSDDTKALIDELNQVSEDIEVESNKSFDDGGLNLEIDKLKERNLELKETIDQYNAQQVLIKRKKQREYDLEKALALLSEIEQKQDLLSLYTKTYLEILNARLEQHFPGIKFMMVEENIKADSWNQTCYVMVESPQGLTPYETSNTESKIKIGVKLADSLAFSLGWEKSTMIIDNAEALTPSNRVFDTDAQTILLIAGENSDEPTPINQEEIKGQQALEI
jgi:hypothetical protein